MEVVGVKVVWVANLDAKWVKKTPAVVAWVVWCWEEGGGQTNEHDQSTAQHSKCNQHIHQHQRQKTGPRPQNNSPNSLGC